MAMKLAKVVALADVSGRAETALVERALREALASIVTPDTHDLALALSLERSGEPRLPTTNRGIASFIEGPFRTSLDQLFGASIARIAVMEAKALTAFMGVTPKRRTESGTRRREPEVVEENITIRPTVDPFAHDTIPAPSSAAGSPVVVLTDDGATFGSIATDLGSRSTVLHAHNLTPFLTVLHEDGLDPVLVLDARQPAIRMRLSEFALRIPSTSHVVFWGEDRDLFDAVPEPRARDNWVAIETDADLADVVAIVSVLAGAR